MWRCMLVCSLGMASCGFVQPSVTQHIKSTSFFRSPLTLHAQGSAQLYTLFEPTKPSLSRRAAVVVLHSGFWGDESTTSGLARALTERGMVVVMPAYRGEKRGLDGMQSEGSVEFCQGEIDDAQAAVHFLQGRGDVDPSRIGLLGLSHGGCIALRTAIREPRIRAVVAFSAPVYANAFARHVENHFLHRIWLAPFLHQFVGSSSENNPKAYAVRSPLFLASQLTMPLLIIHGTADSVMPVEQACWLSQVLQKNGRRVQEHQLQSNGMPARESVALCPTLSPAISSFSSHPSPDTELVLLQGQEHIYNREAAEAAQNHAIAFLTSKLQADESPSPQ